MRELLQRSFVELSFILGNDRSLNLCVLSLKVTYAALRDGPRMLGIAFKVSHGRWTNGGVIRPSFGTNK